MSESKLDEALRRMRSGRPHEETERIMQDFDKAIRPFLDSIKRAEYLANLRAHAEARRN